MSRIIDYVLEPNVLYTGDGFFIRVKVQDDYKYKKYLVSESMKYTTATGTTFTLTNAVSTNNASILQLQGNTTQNGTPTPTSPVEVKTVSGDSSVVICGSNFLDVEKIKTQTWTNGVYRYTRLYDISPTGTWYFQAKLKEGKSAISGLYLDIASGVNPNNSTYAFCIRNGVIQTSGISNTFSGNELYISFYPTSHTIEEITEVYDLWISKTNTDYEPYVGNTYRVDLGGKNSYNLDTSSFPKTSNNGNLTATINEQGVIHITGTKSASGWETVSLNPTSQIIFKAGQLYTATPNINFGMYKVSDSSWVGNRSSSFTPTEDWKASTAYWQTNATGNIDITVYPMIMKGAGTINSNTYSPYVSNPIELCKIGSYVDKLKRAEGKNLFDKSTITSGSYVVSSTGELATLSSCFASDYIPIEPSTQYYWNDIQNRTNEGAFYDSSKTYISGFSNRLFTTPSNAKYVRLTGANTNLDLSQLEKGNAFSSYEPYGNNWYIEKNIGKVVLNGSETWKRTQVSSSNSYAFWNQYANLNLPLGKYGQKYCDRFEYQNKNWNESTPNHLAENNSYTSDLSILFNVDSTVATTLTEWNSWLSTHNTTVYYALATPSYKIITNENLIEQLNNIQDMQLIENLCYVDWVGSIAPTMLLQYPINETLNAYIITEDNKLIRTDWRFIGRRK